MGEGSNGSMGPTSGNTGGVIDEEKEQALALSEAQLSSANTSHQVCAPKSLGLT